MNALSLQENQHQHTIVIKTKQPFQFQLWVLCRDGFAEENFNALNLSAKQWSHQWSANACLTCLE